MKYIIPPMQALLLIVLTILAPILVLFAIPFIRCDDAPSVGPQRTTTPPYPTVMGDFPEDIEGLWTRGDAWKYRKSFGWVRFYAGYTAYALLDGTFRAAPILTIKL